MGFASLAWLPFSAPPPRAPSKILFLPLGFGGPSLGFCGRGQPRASPPGGGESDVTSEPGRERPEARTSLRQRPGCAGPRDICRPRSRLTPRAPPHLPGRCHPPRSGCRLSLRAPRQLPRVLAHRGAQPRDPRARFLWAMASRGWLSHLRPSPSGPRPTFGKLSLILSTRTHCSSPLYSRI